MKGKIYATVTVSAVLPSNKNNNNNKNVGYWRRRRQSAARTYNRQSCCITYFTVHLPESKNMEKIVGIFEIFSNQIAFDPKIFIQ
jgi:hypothetical protein